MSASLDHGPASEQSGAQKKIPGEHIKETMMSIKNSLKGLQAVLVFDNWPMLILGRLLDRRTGLVVYRKSGVEILIDHRGGDCSGTRDCIVSDMYRRYLPFFLLNGPATVLDLGANGGGFPLMLRLVGVVLARVVCVEMNPLTYQRLAVNLATNLGSSAIAVNAAVCGMPEDSEILLAPSRGGTGESIYTHQAEPKRSHVSVRTTTLPLLCNRYFKDESVDICKIDIEGAEYEMFDSCPDNVLVGIKYLLIEFHAPSRTPTVVERIRALGFQEMASEENHKTGAMTEVRAFRGPGVVSVPGHAK
jgi:FkbM family methyltransferase